MNEINYDLIHAVRNGRLEIVRDLVNRYGLSYCKQWGHGYVLLRYAIEFKHTEITKLLLNSGAKVNSNRSEIIPSTTALHLAVENGDQEILEMLLKRGANINKKDAKCRTPLFLATKKGKEDIVEILLKSGSNFCGNEDGITPLHVATINGLSNIAEKLLNYGSYVNSICNLCYSEEGFTPLHFAVERQNEKMATLLLSHGANVDAGSQNMTTPLHIATRKKNVTIVKLLLKNGACVNVKTTEGQTPLHFASKIGNVELMKLLLFSNTEVDPSANNKNITALHVATRNENVTIVELPLRNEACVNAKTTEGLTPLHFASQIGNVELINLLLCSKADVDPSANNNMTPLSFAIKGLHREAAKLLMDHGANVDAEVENGKTILGFAVEIGLATIVEDILQHLPDINIVSNKNSFKIVAKSSELKYVKIVEQLLKYGFSVEPEDINDSSLLQNCVKMGYVNILEDLLKHGLDLSKDQNILLHTASKNKQTEVAKFLLSHGAYVNALDMLGNPPIFYSTENSDVNTTELLLLHGANIQKFPELLMIATKKLCKKMVEVLLKNQADIEATDCLGRKALHLIALSEYKEYRLSHTKYDYLQAKEKILKFLLSKGANVNAKTDIDGLTVLHIACQKSSTNVVKILLKYKADVDCIAKDFTPLHIAAQNGEGQIVKMLLANGANVNAKRKNGETSLHIAVKQRHFNVLNVLLKNDADIESKNIYGATPLHSAAAQHNCEIVLVLLQQGAIIDAKDKEGNTALHIACEEENEEIISLLLEFGSDINIMTSENKTPIDQAGFYNYSYNEEEEREEVESESPTLKILKLHLIKLKAANLYINEKNLSWIDKVDDSLTSYQADCAEEVDKLKQEKIVNKVSFYDILKKNTHSLTKYARNEEIVQTFESYIYKLKFPIYAKMIEQNFKKGFQRKILLAQSHGFVESYLKLPYGCVDQIMSYLSDVDLKIIIDLWKQLSSS